MWRVVFIVAAAEVITCVTLYTLMVCASSSALGAEVKGCDSNRHLSLCLIIPSFGVRAESWEW
jgi:hypothetical protein